MPGLDLKRQTRRSRPAGFLLIRKSIAWLSMLARVTPPLGLNNRRSPREPLFASP